MSGSRGRFDRRTSLQLIAGLGAGLGAGLAAGPALALGKGAKVRIAQLRYSGGDPLPRPSALKRLAWELDKRTSIDMALEPIVLGLGDKRIFRHPLLYLGGDRGFELPEGEQIAVLRRHLVYGGTLLIDSAEARPGGAFDRSARALVSKLFPEGKLERIPSSHTLYKSFYLLDRAVGRVATVPYLEGVSRDGRMVIIYSQNDLAGAWARDNFGRWIHSVYPGDQHQRELAFRWGINVVMYALCVDYKSDQVHIPFILKRRRWHLRR